MIVNCHDHAVQSSNLLGWDYSSSNGNHSTNLDELCVSLFLFGTRIYLYRPARSVGHTGRQALAWQMNAVGRG